MEVTLYHNQRWLHFTDPVRVLRARQLDEVIPCLEEAERSGLFAAGFIAYEAAPAFDTALTAYPPGVFPLLCLGLFRSPCVLTECPAGSGHHRVGELCPSVTREAFGAAIDEIKRHIAAGATYQVNYTYRLRGAFTGDARAFFRALVEDQRLEHAAFVDTGDYAVCSASPELFFQRENGGIISRPMKGTARRGLTWAEDRRVAESLRHSEKDRAENVMIVDMIRNDIGRVARPGTVHTPARFTIEKYPTVWHMTSTVTGDSDASVTDILKALFPCASITGAPKAKTMEIIRGLETSPRNVYTGSVGFIAPTGDACFNVAIRTALIDRRRQRLEFGVGGGIVWDSEADAEFEETVTKAWVLTQPRPAFDLLETMLYEPGKGVFLLDRHMDRLSRSADYFGIPVNAAAIRKTVLTACENALEGALKVRLLVSKSGAVTVETASFTSRQSLSPGAVKIKVCLALRPVNSRDVFLYHKTTRRQVYTNALAACRQAGEKDQKGLTGALANHERTRREKAVGRSDDVILWNERGEVTESCVANVVIQRDGRLLTPPVASGLLGGVFREHLLAQGKITEAVVTVEALKTADKIFLINSVRRWRDAVLVDA
ncbi:MAG: aminodeoxychorismate synthase component I [Lentisphaeria bacterium]|nr:aminodeoxychorismate synthase component I [Lentisphaeria bacterium]